jgi:hypothetical protein
MREKRNKLVGGSYLDIKDMAGRKPVPRDMDTIPVVAYGGASPYMAPQCAGPNRFLTAFKKITQKK